MKKKRWALAWVASALTMSSCAEDNPVLDGPAAASSTGPTGSGGDGGGDGGAGSEGGGPSAGGAGGTPSDCGNGTIDRGEACDGEDFGGATCESLGAGTGELACTSSCEILTALCVQVESCNDLLDNDENGDIDCDDAACATDPGCLDSCAAPIEVTAPVDFFFVSTIGRPDVHAAGCTAETGPELVVKVLVPYAGRLGLAINGALMSQSLAAGTVCPISNGPLGCIDCGENFADYMWLGEVSAGDVYYVMIDGTDPGQEGSASLAVFLLPHETGPTCLDSQDNDQDGYVDCDDPDCDGDAACVAGPGIAGAACASHTDCASSDGDPHCLPSTNVAYPGGYCTEFCQQGDAGCTGDALCMPFGLSKHGVCLDGCATNADCRAGYQCVDSGQGTSVCFHATDSDCTNQQDDDYDGLTDCQEPECQDTAYCAPGPAPVGSECSAASDCQANMNDPYCMTALSGWPNGYCSEFCDLDANDCGPDAACTDAFGPGPAVAGRCLRTCDSPQDCRPGYTCEELWISGAATSVCRFEL
jgi:hypothetical protein